MLTSGERGLGFDSAAGKAVADSVRRQAEAGIDIANDGEVAKPSFATYVTERLCGFVSERRDRARTVEMGLIPDFYSGAQAPRGIQVMTCVGSVVWRGDELVSRDIARLEASIAGRSFAEVFMSAAAPGLVWYYQPNRYYPSHEEYIWAVAEAMKHEYDAIHEAGFMLQLDCPDLAGGWNRPEFADLSVKDFQAFARHHVEALNHATRDIPPERMRMHVCWGNYEGPHVRDIPLRSIIDILLEARPAGLSVEGANPRHEHEWEVFSHVALPDNKILIPGVIDSTTNYVEHPELVAHRITRYAGVVGSENVIAGTDCGFATLASSDQVHPTVAWMKLASLVEGARLASERMRQRR
jgi:5-methyltetrahydropteroyltriglutamate--homocysteine methyltransferase